MGDALAGFMSAFFLYHFCMKCLVTHDLSSIISFYRTTDVGDGFIYTNIKRNSAQLADLFLKTMVARLPMHK